MLWDPLLMTSWKSLAKNRASRRDLHGLVPLQLGESVFNQEIYIHGST